MFTVNSRVSQKGKSFVAAIYASSEKKTIVVSLMSVPLI
jgi:hypothetical protein